LVKKTEGILGVKKMPIVGQYCILKSQAYVYINKEMRTKLDPKYFDSYFVGYNNSSKTY
jgi:hypothetical protein